MRKRSTHKPKPKTIPIIFRIAPPEETNLKLIPHQSLDLILNGNATEQDWHVIASRLNVGAQNAKRFEGLEPVIYKAIGAMRSLKAREKLVLTGDEHRAIGAALNLCDDMQSEMTRREMRDDMRVAFNINEKMLRDAS